MTNNIKIKNEKSSLAEFVKRAVPTSEENEAFEQYVQKEARAEEIKDSLSEIYQDDNGDMVDVKKLDIKKRRGFFFYLFTTFIMLGLTAAAGYAVYNYLFPRLGPNTSPVELVVDGPKEILAGQEFNYKIDIKNNDKVGINKIELKLRPVENFIFISSQPPVDQKNLFFSFKEIPAYGRQIIDIKGKLIGEELSAASLTAELSYQPENFSSVFSKEAVFNTVISALGLKVEIVSPTSVFVNEESEITVKYQPTAENYINQFVVMAEPSDNLIFLNASSSSPGSFVKANSWTVSAAEKIEKELKIIFKINKKTAAQQNLSLSIAQQLPEENGIKYYIFYKKIISLEVIQGALNMTLIVNGSSLDQAVDFGQSLNYSLTIANRGETALKEILIMAVIESDILDWQTLKDANSGQVQDKTLSWSKNELPILAELPQNGETTIDFSIKLKPLAAVDLAKDYSVKSYAQFSIEGKPLKPGEDNRSNTIINKINTDLTLNQQIRYFNDDNLAVGSGPLPPKVGQTTSFKVYWTIKNNLHELTDLSVIAKLPDYVSWDDKSQVNVGNLNYDSQNRQITWQIGRLPISVYRTDAEFNISLTPAESDRRKIIVLLPGTVVSGTDKETAAKISKQLLAKTTKLEDDPIAASDGVVE